MKLVLLAAALAGLLAAQSYRDLYSDSWSATDALGRSIAGYPEAGAPHPDTTVGIFYFIWHTDYANQGLFDISELLSLNPANPPWGPQGHFHWWGQPELGYYSEGDTYVYRKHALMLANAGVDVIVLDATNGYTYPDAYLPLCQVYRDMRGEGLRTPRIAFMTQTNGAATIQQLYRNFYAPGLYPELWFDWQGKPLILGTTAGLPPDVAAFFTFRQPGAWTARAHMGGWFQSGYDKWPWIDYYPQTPGWDQPGRPEEIPVAVAQHPVLNIGRSYHDGQEPATPAPAEGLHFAEQWRQALAVRPPFVFVTGWNEWIAQRQVATGQEIWPAQFLGAPLAAGETYFVDEYNQEFSRDIEPMRGGHTDDYYYQLVDAIRRYKGVRRPPRASGPKTIAIGGGFGDWGDVQPEFRDAAYDTLPRNHAGWGGNVYTDYTGRNDFVTLKVTYDAANVYFYAETRDAITPWTGPYWMLLFIDADRNWNTGWNGYDFVVNATVGAQTTAVQRLTADGQPGAFVAQAPYAVAGNRLELAIPRRALGIAPGAPVALDFKWADNIQAWGDPIEFAIHGDSAPDRRFNYRYWPERRAGRVAMQ